MTVSRPLSRKAADFARLYGGDGVRAAEAAGYRGSRPSLASIASRLLKDPRVALILEARRAGARSAREVSAAQGADDPDLSDGTPLEVLRALMNDPIVTPSTRARIAELLARRADRVAGVDVDPFGVLRKARVAAQRVRRDRDRDDPLAVVLDAARRVAKHHPAIAAELRELAERHAPPSPSTAPPSTDPEAP